MPGQRATGYVMRMHEGHDGTYVHVADLVEYVLASAQRHLAAGKEAEAGIMVALAERLNEAYGPPRPGDKVGRLQVVPDGDVS